MHKLWVINQILTKDTLSKLQFYHWSGYFIEINFQLSLRPKNKKVPSDQNNLLNVTLELAQRPILKHIKMISYRYRYILIAKKQLKIAPKVFANKIWYHKEYFLTQINPFHKWNMLLPNTAASKSCFDIFFIFSKKTIILFCNVANLINIIWSWTWKISKFEIWR